MDDLDDLMNEIKIENKKGKKLAAMTPSARQLKIKKIELAEKAEKQQEEEYNARMMFYLFGGICVLGFVCEFTSWVYHLIFGK